MLLKDAVKTGSNVMCLFKCVLNQVMFITGKRCMQSLTKF